MGSVQALSSEANPALGRLITINRTGVDFQCLSFENLLPYANDDLFLNQLEKSICPKSAVWRNISKNITELPSIRHPSLMYR